MFFINFNAKTSKEANIKSSGFKYVWDIVYSKRDGRFYAVKSYSGSSELLISDHGTEGQGVNAVLSDDDMELNFLSVDSK